MQRKIIAASNATQVEPLYRIETESVVSSTILSADGQFVIVGCRNGSVWLWDISGDKPAELMRIPIAKVSNIDFSVSLSLNSNKTILTNNCDKAATLWDVSTGRATQTFIGHELWVSSVVLSENGQVALTGSQDMTARLWDTITGEEIQTFSGHEDWIDSVALNWEKQIALTGSHDNTARLWDTVSGQQIQKFAGHKNWVRSVALSRDGQTILTGSEDRTVRLWDIATAETLQRFVGFIDTVWSVAFSPDAKVVLTGSDDPFAQMWDAITGQEIQRFPVHPSDGAIYSVGFSQDGTRFVTGGSNASIVIWGIR